MGRWSYDILGGDTALDARNLIFEVCDIEQFTEGETEDDVTENELPAEVLSEKYGTIARTFGEVMPDDYNECIIVLGYMMMQRGAAMTGNFVVALFEAIDKDMQAWKGFDERLDTLQKFKDLVSNYDGKPVELHSRTVFDAFAEADEKADKEEGEPPMIINVPDKKRKKKK
jgi:hypothetical protein